MAKKPANKQTEPPDLVHSQHMLVQKQDRPTNT